MEQDHAELIKQLEYYLSDKNLEYDEFFYNKVQDGTDGFVELGLFLNCNKIKKLKVDHEDIQNAVEKSEVLELREDKHALRRKDRHLPEYKGLLKKRSVQKSEANASPSKAKEQTQEAPKDEGFVCWVLYIPDSSNLPKNGKLIEETIGEQYEMVVPFARTGKVCGGHLCFDRNGEDNEKIEKLVNNGFEFEGNHVEVVEANGKEMNYFHKEYRPLLEKIVKKKFGKKLSKKKEKNADAKKRYDGEVEFLGKKYQNVSMFTQVFKNLLSKTKNGGTVDSKNTELLTELVKHHEKSEEKLQELESFTVDYHPVYKQTRCFFIVKKDGSKEDFSLHKCLNNFTDKLMK